LPAWFLQIIIIKLIFLNPTCFECTVQSEFLSYWGQVSACPKMNVLVNSHAKLSNAGNATVTPSKTFLNKGFRREEALFYKERGHVRMCPQILFFEKKDKKGQALTCPIF
jgi:hypothetical protein